MPGFGHCGLQIVLGLLGKLVRAQILRGPIREQALDVTHIHAHLADQTAIRRNLQQPALPTKMQRERSARLQLVELRLILAEERARLLPCRHGGLDVSHARISSRPGW